AHLVQLLQHHHPDVLAIAQQGGDDPEVDAMFEGAKEPSAVGTGHMAAGVPGIGMMPAPGMQQLAPAGPNNMVNPMSQGGCPHCGAMITPGQGICPQCNSAISPMDQGSSAVNPQAPVGPAGQAMQPVMASFHEQIIAERTSANQGPHNLEQVQAVVEYLKSQGQDFPGLTDDIVAHPENYGDILAEIQGKSQPPEPDPDPGPAPMPDPSQMGGQGMPPAGAPGGAGGGMPMMAAAPSIVGPQSLEEQQLNSDFYPRNQAVVTCPGCNTPTVPSLGGCPHCGMNFHPDLIKRAGRSDGANHCPSCQQGLMDAGTGTCYLCGYTYPYDGAESLDGHTSPKLWAREQNLPFVHPSVFGPVHQGASDSITPPCPKCQSHTTGLITDSGEAQCSNCNHKWQTDFEPQGDQTPVSTKAAFHHDDLHDHALAVPAADQQRPDDPALDDNPGGTWSTQDGQPLTVGQEYEMYSAKYDVPDIVRIEAVKPDSIEYSLTGEYGLNHKTQLSKQEADMDGTTFVPTDSADPAENLNEESAPDQQMQAPAPDSHEFGMRANVRTADGLHQNEFGYSQPSTPDQFVDRAQQRYQRGQAGYERWQPGQYGNILAMPNNDVHAWNVPQRDNNPQAIMDYAHSKFMKDTGIDMSQPVRTGHITPDSQVYWHGVQQGSPEHQQLMSLVPHLQPGTYDMADEDWDEPDQFAHAASVRTAGKKFTPMEQREFIDEPGVARNSDKLDLAGTHYESRASMIDDDFYLFGL
ncbi:MAG: hypothetical protein JWR61_5866, partial [Ferruginibacter sp.]|uniref:hypothetical protein n=1 Tax=Ferruginibacter sp. TaxID=1940288 RepID=UPI0026591BBF